MGADGVADSGSVNMAEVRAGWGDVQPVQCRWVAMPGKTAGTPRSCAEMERETTVDPPVCVNKLGGNFHPVL